MRNKKRYDILRTSSVVLVSLYTLFTVLLFFSANWYIRNFGDTGFDSVLYTLLSKKDGVNEGLLSSYLLEGALPSLLICAVVLFLIYFPKLLRIRCLFRNIIALALAGVFLYYAGENVNLFGYLRRLTVKSTVYDEYFVEPTSDNITFPENKRNLIYIFLESIETTYLSKEEGGALDVNVMPELTKLAENNISFSHNDGIGGFLSPEGTGWTVAGMVSQTSGVPLRGSAGVLANNEYGSESFLPGVITLFDILNANGYNQALMVGSNSTYANRDVYFREHKTDTIYDYETAKKDNIIADDYYVWWGMEDEYLFGYAKAKIKEIAKKKEPFAFTMLTVDTHFKDGYYCRRCRNKHNEQYSNVISCASKQVASFVNWIKKQSFYNNTTIVICGDHPTMDYQFIQRNVPDEYERRVYNCIINSAVQGENYKNRVFTSLDLFPTTLAAMGCEVKGDRLGLGTNLFSDKKTLAEEMGYNEFERQLLFSSDYYIKNFMIDNEE